MPAERSSALPVFGWRIATAGQASFPGRSGCGNRRTILFLLTRGYWRTDFDANFTRLAPLRFDLSSVTGTVTAAKLTLGVKLTELDANVTFTLNLLPDGANLDTAPGAGGWDETGITMANSFLAGELPLIGAGGRHTVLGGIDTIAEFSGNTLRDRIRENTNDLVTFALLPLFNSPQGIQFFSKENADGGLIPTLELTVIDENTASITEPGTLALFGFGLIGLGFARRKATR